MWFDVEMDFSGLITLSQEAASEEEAIELMKDRVINSMPAGTQCCDVSCNSVEEIK